MLFDVDARPYETKNLADDPAVDYTLFNNARKTRYMGKKNAPIYLSIRTLPDRESIHIPVHLGIIHKEDIQKYIAITDLNLLNF